MVEYRSRWYLLDLANGMYMMLGTQGEFLSCPCLLESGGFIYETYEGRFFCETLADPDEKHVAIQREYALDDRKVFFADGQIYVVLNSKPWKPESFYTHIQVPTPDSTLLVMHKNPSEEEFMLVETKTSLRSNDMTACITTMTRHWW